LGENFNIELLGKEVGQEECRIAKTMDVVFTLARKRKRNWEERRNRNKMKKKKRIYCTH